MFRDTQRRGLSQIIAQMLCPHQRQSPIWHFGVYGLVSLEIKKYG